MDTRPSALSFRGRLTLRWTAAFGLLLAAANLSIYFGAHTFLSRDFDAKLRTIGATEAASAIDESGGIHLHDFPVEAFGEAEYTGKFGQIFSADGSVVVASRGLGTAGPLMATDTIDQAIAGEAPLVSVRVHGRPARMVGLRVEYEGAPYVVGVGLFRDRLDSHLWALAFVLTAVWLVGMAATAGVGFALASRALAPIDAITTRAGRIVRGDLAARLDPPHIDDEIGRMTNLLNDVLDRLHEVIEANRRFAADASHELRSPLTAMVGEVDVALKRERTPPEYRATLALVRERLQEMAELTDNLMTLVRAEEGVADRILREVPLAPLVDAAIVRIASLTRMRQIEIVRGDIDPLVAYGDPRLYARAVDNLIANAVQYNRDGGRITVAGYVDELLDGAWQPSEVVLTIDDTGPGIPEADWERIFERFRRLDASRSRATGGTGLGLAICRAVVSLYGGQVLVRSSSPEGTRFELRLPGRSGRAPVAHTADAVVDPGTTARIT